MIALERTSSRYDVTDPSGYEYTVTTYHEATSGDGWTASVRVAVCGHAAERAAVDALVAPLRRLLAELES